MGAVVFRQALRDRWRTIVVLSAGLGAFFYLILFASATLAAEFASTPFFRNPPRAMTAFLGGSADFTQAAGWFSVGMSHPVVLALSTAGALVIAAGCVAGEVERGSIEFVLTRPVGRVTYLLATSAAALVGVTAVQIGGLAATQLARWTVSGVDAVPVRGMLWSFFGSWVLFSSFALCAVAASALSSLRSRATGIAAGAVIVAFFANFLALLLDSVGWMRYGSPFHYFRSADIIRGAPFAWDIGVLAAFGALCLAVALNAFAVRDLTR